MFRFTPPGLFKFPGFNGYGELVFIGVAAGEVGALILLLDDGDGAFIILGLKGIFGSGDCV